MTVQTVADIVGANTKVPIGAAGQRTRRLMITASGGAARFGDTNAAAARGLLLPQNVPVTISASDADRTDTMDLGSVYAYIPSGTTLTVAFLT